MYAHSAYNLNAVNRKMIELQPQQQAHVSLLTDVLAKHKCAMDFSVMGAGKTYPTSYLSLLPHFHFAKVVVVCPVSVQSKWLSMGASHGVPIIKCISYQALRAAKGRQPAHGLLHRFDEPVDVNGRSVNRVRFRATEEFERATGEGVLLVIDEFQHLKNISAQFEAARSLVKAIKASTHSRCLLLSGSPFDRVEHSVALLKTLGIMIADELTIYDRSSRTSSWSGAQEVVDWCRCIDQGGTQKVLDAWRYCTPTQMAYQLFQQVVKPALQSSMPQPALKYCVSKYNAFYKMDPPDLLPQLIAGIEALKRVVGYDPVKQSVNFATSGISNSMGALTTALCAIERAKVPTMICAARRYMQAHPGCKLVVCVNYTDSINKIIEELADFAPLILDGRVPGKVRAKVIDMFQKPDLDRRLLVGNMHVCSTGIDLDDKHGDFPRLCIVSPNYSTLPIHQLGHRFLRLDSKGSSEVQMFYIEEATELPVLAALAKKGGVMKDTTKDQVEAGVVFPCDYPSKHCL